MKNIICLTLTALFILLACVCGATANTYTKMTQIVEIDISNDTVTCVDSAGEMWEFYGTDGWSEGDFVALTMDTKGTKNIYDDEIIKTVYKGGEKKINLFFKKRLTFTRACAIIVPY